MEQLMSDPVDEIIETVVETVEEAGEQLVSLKPSKTLLVLLAVGGLAAGICVGWYLAGGMKIEEEFYGGADAGAVSDVSADVVESDADVANGSDE
jgi:hypothetical protein